MTQKPKSAVMLRLTQQGQSWTLDTEDASGPEQSYAITWRGDLPEELKKGAAMLSAGDAVLTVTVR